MDLQVESVIEVSQALVTPKQHVSNTLATHDPPSQIKAQKKLEGEKRCGRHAAGGRGGEEGLKAGGVGGRGGGKRGIQGKGGGYEEQEVVSEMQRLAQVNNYCPSTKHALIENVHYVH